MVLEKTIQSNQIEILDYETSPHGQFQRLKCSTENTSRWKYAFPFWIDYGVYDQELAMPLRCDFSEICEWAMDKQLIEDYSIEPKEGWVLIPGTSHVEWSPWKQDAVETFTGRYSMNFAQFLNEFLTEKDLCEFISFWREK